MTSLAIRNPIAVLMACLCVIVFAGVVTPRMSVDTFPELTPPVLVVVTQVPGLGPKDVEKTITWRLEKYVSATPGVDHIESVSRNSLSLITVWLKWGTDLGAAQILVQQQVAFAMAAVPKSLGVVPPFVLQLDPANAPVVQIIVSGGGMSGAQLYDFALNNVSPLVEGIPGVASAAPDGGQLRQINVIVDPIRASARRITASDVSQSVAQSNALLPSGELLSRTFDANVYTNSVPPRVRMIGDSLVTLQGGKPVFLKDVARIEDGGAPQTQWVSVNGRPAVYLNVLRVPGGNTLEIVETVKRVVASLKNLPPGLEVRPVFDQSTFVRATYEGLKSELARALVLISIVILLFLQSVRGTVIVAVAIPLSFAVTLIFLYATGQTLNAFTLGGMTLAMGRLVDDAVVVLESIHRQRALGLDAREAAIKGTEAVALPVLASTLTTIAVLMPVMLLAGLARRLFAPLAITVVVSMLASYVISVAVTPVACRYFLGHHGTTNRLWKGIERAIARVADGYTGALRRVLPLGWLVLGSIALLVAASGVIATRLPSTFFPEIDESMERIYIRFAPGTSLEQAGLQVDRIGETLRRELPKGCVELVVANVGAPSHARSAMSSPNWGPNMGFLRVELSPPEKRTLSQQQIADLSRVILEREFPGVEMLQSPGGLVASVFSSGYPAPLVVEVRGERLDEVDAQARAVAAVARTIPGIRDVRSTLELAYPEIRVEVERERAGFAGVTARVIGQATLDATLGNINAPSVWVDPDNGQSYYVVTSQGDRATSDAQSLGGLAVRVSDQGKPVSLGAYSKISLGTGPQAIERHRLGRVVHVLAQVEGRDLGTVAADLDAALARDPSTRRIPIEMVGQIGLMRTTFGGLQLALGLAVMLVFMIMASQFRSVRLPFIMLFTIPVAVIGIVAALLGAGLGFSITALMGVLMVIGIAVSNGILLVDAAARRLEEGATPDEAVLSAARSRFIPIVMTSLATVIGLIPTALGLEHGSETNQPLALAVVGGLTSSTLLSLFLVPLVFLKLTRRGGAGTSSSSPAP